MLESSLPKELVATHVKTTESIRSDRLILRSDFTPSVNISSRIVYLKKKNDYINFNYQQFQI